MNKIVVIDGQAELLQTIDGDAQLFNNLDGEAGSFYEVSAGTRNYEDLYNKPSIESVELVGDKTFEELGMMAISNIELANLIK